METYAYYNEFDELEYFTGSYDEFMDFLDEHPEYYI
jgi:hypothetical protein